MLAVRKEGEGRRKNGERIGDKTREGDAYSVPNIPPLLTIAMDRATSLGRSVPVQVNIVALNVNPWNCV